MMNNFSNENKIVSPDTFTAFACPEQWHIVQGIIFQTRRSAAQLRTVSGPSLVSR